MSTNPELNIPVNQDFTFDPEPHSPPAGDWNDDDGRALASYFLANDPLPLVSKIVKAVVDALPAPVGTDEKPLGNRLMQRNYVLGLTANQPAVYALPPDANRLRVIIRELNSNGFYFSDSMFVPVDDISATVNHQTPATFVGSTANGQQASITLDDYTGPLYVSGRATGGTSIVEIVAITA